MTQRKIDLSSGTKGIVPLLRLPHIYRRHIMLARIRFRIIPIKARERMQIYYLLDILLLPLDIRSKPQARTKGNRGLMIFLDRRYGIFNVHAPSISGTGEVHMLLLLFTSCKHINAWHTHTPLKCTIVPNSIYYCFVVPRR
jgi:hypothetical protein